MKLSHHRHPSRTPVPNAPEAVAITATNRDAFPNHGDGKAHEGDTITYTVAITNSGDANATGVIMRVQSISTLRHWWLVLR
jgi:hypothetical protein